MCKRLTPEDSRRLRGWPLAFVLGKNLELAQEKLFQRRKNAMFRKILSAIRAVLAEIAARLLHRTVVTV